MTETKPSYELLDCAEQHARYPDTFGIPDAHEIEAIRFGDCVKLIFKVDDPETGCGAERMWVQVTTAEAGRCTGILVNMPTYVPLDYGDTIEFTSANIACIETAPGDAMAAEFAG